MLRRLSFIVLWACAAAAQAATPATLNYQGRIRLAGGAFVPDGTGNTLVFHIYDAGGTSLWNETWNSATSCVTTTAGLFNVVLGSFSTLALPFDQPYFLGIAVNGDPEMIPRQPLTSSPYAFHAKIADSASVYAPLNLTANAGVAVLTLQQSGVGAGLSASASGSNSIGIYGTSSDVNGVAIKAEAATNNAAMSVSNFGNGRGFSAGAGNAEAVYGVGKTGVAGVAIPNGVGVVAGDGGNAGSQALKVTGGSSFSGGNVTFSGQVDFSGATVTGWNVPAVVFAPLSLALNSPTVAGIYSNNLGSGLAVSASSSAGLGLYAQGAAMGSMAVGSASSAATVVGLSGTAANNNFSGTSAIGVYGNAVGAPIVNKFGIYGEAGAGTGVYGNGGIGVYGNGSTYGVQGMASSGIGVLGGGQTGTAGSASVPGGIGVLAGDGGQLNALALRVKGNALFSPGSVTFSTTVDFSGATITGWSLPATIAVPLTLTGSVAFPGAVAQAGNLGSGFGLMGSTTGSGAVSGTGTAGVAFTDSLTAGVYGASSSSISAGVLGRNFDTSQSNVGVMGLSLNGTGVYGESYGTSGGTGGQFISLSGTALQAQGLNGLSAQVLGAGGTAISADTNSNVDRTALSVRGPANFSSYTNGTVTSAVVFNSPVQFNGTVSGLNSSNAEPFIIGGGTPSSALQVSNTNTGFGDAASFSSYQGNGINIQSPNTGIQITVSNSSGTNAFGISANISSTAAGGAIWGSNMSLNTYGLNANAVGHYINVQTSTFSSPATGIFAYASATAATAVGVHGEAHVGVGTYGAGVEGQSDSSVGYGVNASNTNATGVGLFASGGQYSIRLGNTMDANANRISNLMDPVNPQDVASKNYVDTHGGSVPNPLLLTNNPGGSVIEGQNTGSGIGVEGFSNTGIGVNAQGAIGMQSMGTNFGLSVTATNGGGFAIYALNTGSGSSGGAIAALSNGPSETSIAGVNGSATGNSVGVLGQTSSGIGFGVAGFTQGGNPYMGPGAGVYGYTGSTNQAGVIGEAPSSIGVYAQGVSGLQAMGTNLGVSATATSFTGNAFYGRVDSSGAAAIFTNDNSSGTPLQINDMKFPWSDAGFAGEFLTTNGSGVLSFAPAVQAPFSLSGSLPNAIINGLNSNTGAGVEGQSNGSGPGVEGLANVSGPGVQGLASTSQNIGLQGVQISSAANLTNQGVALQVSGPVRVDSWTSSAENDASTVGTSYPLSFPRSSGSIVFGSGKTGLASYTVTDTNFVGTNSVVLVSFSGITSGTSTYSVISQTANSFVVSFGATAAVISAGSYLNFLIIRQ